MVRSNATPASTARASAMTNSSSGVSSKPLQSGFVSQRGDVDLRSATVVAGDALSAATAEPGSPLLSPVEGTLLNRVNITEHQDADETQHAPEDGCAMRDRLTINDRPRIHEDDLEIEQDKEHRHEVKLHAEPRRSFPLWNHAAFIRHVFRPGAPAGFTH